MATLRYSAPVLAMLALVSSLEQGAIHRVHQGVGQRRRRGGEDGRDATDRSRRVHDDACRALSIP